MKVKYILLSATIIFSSGAFAQEDKNIVLRHSLQQRFIIKNFPFNDQKLSIENTNQIDSIFLILDKQWRKYVDDSLASEARIPKKALYNLDAYNYMWTLFNLSGKFQHPKHIDHHLVKNYMLPSLVNDLNILKEDIILQFHRLIWMGSLDNTLSKGSIYYEDKEVINNLYALITDLEGLLKEFLPEMDAETASYNRRLLSTIKDNKYDIAAKYNFLNQQYDGSFQSFITGVSTNQYPISRIYSFGKALIAHFSETGAKNKSFAILNNITFSTSIDDIPRDSLKVLYYEIDSSRGPAFYKQVNQKLNGSLLSHSGVTLKSSPDEWNYIFNGLEQDKLQKVEYILIDFWYTGCKPCIEEVPALNVFHEQLRQRDDLVFVSINTDHFEGKRSKEFTKGTIKKFDIKFPVVFDDDESSISKELEVNGYPTKMIMDRNGKILKKADGSAITIYTFKELLLNNN